MQISLILLKIDQIGQLRCLKLFTFNGQSKCILLKTKQANRRMLKCNIKETNDIQRIRDGKPKKIFFQALVKIENF